MFSFSTTTTTTTATSSTSSESSLSLLTSTPTDVETSATITVTLTTTESTTTPPTTVANSSKMPPTTTTAYSFEQGQQQQHFTGTTSTSEQTANDPYETYTNNFDLSLLPQDYNNNNNTNNSCTEINDTNSNNINQTNLIDNIPTTVYNFNVTTSETQKQQQQPELLQEKSNCLAVPDIKIEQTWSSCPSLNTIKQEQIYQSYFPLKTEQNQLVPPPPPTYPIHFYPSPQSSPAQSEYNFPQTQFNSLKLSSTTCYESLSSSRNSLYNAASSPCPSLDVNAIKQEQLHILPPSPPESNCDTPTPQSNYSRCSSGFDFKSEPFDSDVETLSDLNKTNQSGAPTFTDTSADHQLLREYLEDTSFLKRNNLKPLALESFIGGLEEVRDNIEPVISLALEHAKREADATCAKLQISQDPTAWSANQVHAWLRSTLQQFKLPIVDDIEEKFNETGAELLQLTEDEFIKRIPECGSTLHAQLEIWKVAYSPEYSKTCNLSQNYATNNMWSSNGLYTYNNSMEEDTKDEDDFLNSNTAQSNNNIINSQEAPHQTTISNFVNNNEMLNRNSNGINNNHTASEGNNLVLPVKRTGTRNGGSHIHLWQFLKELLAAPHINGTAIRWIDRSKGIFKIEDSVRVAKLWGKRKNRPAMNYDKLSRSIRQYYKKGIMKKTERSQRLVYQFCQPYHM